MSEEDSWGSTPHKFDAWICTKIGFLTLVSRQQKKEIPYPSNPGIVAKTRYCLMIITEFGYKARFLAWWICVIFRFQTTSSTHMSCCGLVLCRFIWWTKMDELHQNFMHLSFTFDEKAARCIFEGNMCLLGTNNISTQIGLKCLVGWLQAQAVSTLNQHPWKVLLCIYLMFKGVQRASACEDIFFIFMV